MSNQRNDLLDSFFNTPEQRKLVPLVFIIDVSGSMDTLKTDLNKAIRELLRQMKEDTKLRNCVDLLVIHFNGVATTVVDFEHLEKVNESDVVLNENVELKGNTDTGNAIHEAINKSTEMRAKVFEESGKTLKPTYPLVFLLTDGIPDAGIKRDNETYEDYQKEVDRVNQAYQSASETIKQLERENHITFVATGIKHPNHSKSVLEEKLKELTIYPDHVIIIEGTHTDFRRFCNIIYEGTKTHLENTDKGNTFNSFCDTFIFPT